VLNKSKTRKMASALQLVRRSLFSSVRSSVALRSTPVGARHFGDAAPNTLEKTSDGAFIVDNTAFTVEVNTYACII